MAYRVIQAFGDHEVGALVGNDAVETAGAHAFVVRVADEPKDPPAADSAPSTEGA